MLRKVEGSLEVSSRYDSWAAQWWEGRKLLTGTMTPYPFFTTLAPTNHNEVQG
jgi:hypothetical protein